MPYKAEISRANPTCLLFLLDQSGSMSDPLGGQGPQKKADAVADVINRFLQELVLTCARTEGVRDYFQVGVLGYGNQVGAAFGGTLAGRNLVPLSDLANNPLRVEQRTKQVDDGAGGLVGKTVKFPVWFEPTAEGLTPMCEVLNAAWNILNDFIVNRPACYPPTVINITDGEATDGDPEPAAAMIRELASQDGNVLLFNIHISSLPEQPITFPDQPAALPDDYARMLFRMSSAMTPQSLGVAGQQGLRLAEGARGFAFNADLVTLIRFVDIGTRVGAKNLR